MALATRPFPGPSRSAALVLATLGVGAVLAGCGSSASSSSSPASSSAASAPAAPASGGYGGAAAPAASSQAAGAAQIMTKNAAKLGTILAGRKSLTLYLFEADHGATSSCSGACAQVWPPVLTTGRPAVGSGATGALLGTTARGDGTTQVTYKGHPLYYYAKDGDAGDAYGQGIKSFGASWYVLSPDGAKVDRS